MHYRLATAQRHIMWHSRDKPWASNNESESLWLRRMMMQMTLAGLARVRLQVCALWKECWFRSSLSYPNVSFTQRTVLCTDVTFPDDLVACVHKSCTHTSRSHAQPWQRTHTSRSHAQPWQSEISHLLGVKTEGVTQCKQNRHVPHEIFN